MKLGNFRKQTKDLPDGVTISIAEVDQAAAMNVTSVDIVDGATIKDKKAEGQEAIDLDGGKQQAIVLRY